ncbi:MAG: response regulator, partial [Gammaproteobacteria bacterium]|nr:response regulator [Gammaproteobacteria bacterium]
GMMQDITEMRAVQRALQSHRDHLEKVVTERTAELVDARNRAEELARTKSDFLANMSHEIRTPMSAVLGLSQIGMRESHNRKIAHTFEQILEAGGHLLNVVNDVLDVSKLEAGTLATESIPFQVRKAVSACAEMLRPRAQAKSLKMQVCVAEDFPDWVLGDSFRVQQILINLMSNAVKFTEKGSIFLDVYREDEVSCFKVRDTGIGMSAEQLERLFKPFHQFENSLTRNHEGAGLGLSISNTLAGLMGGGISVLSEPGGGSEFILRLPMPEGMGSPSMEEVGGGSDESDVQRLGGIRVLVADDVRINRTIVEALLEAEGATVTTAANGAEAVAAVSGRGKEAFDVILMDLEMPKMDGRQATRRIRVLQPALPIIGLTAHVSEEQRAQSLESGMNDQLVKPVWPEALVAAILRVTPERRNVSPEASVIS